MAAVFARGLRGKYEVVCFGTTIFCFHDIFTVITTFCRNAQLVGETPWQFADAKGHQNDLET